MFMFNKFKFTLIAIFAMANFLACTYDERFYEETVVETVDATTPDARPTPPQETGDDMRGWSLSKNLTMGVSTPDTSINGASLAGPKGSTVATDPNAPQDDSVESATYTIQIGIVESNDALNANGPPNLRAYITWLTNGNGQQRWVSVGGGTSITGSAQGVSVVLQDFTGEPVDEDLAEYAVTVTATPGNRATSAVGPILVPLANEVVLGPFGTTHGVDGTVNLGHTGGPGSASYIVPSNVGVQSYYIQSGLNGVDAPVLTIQQLDISAGVLAARTWNPSDGFIPLMPRCTNVNIINGSGALVNEVSLLWGIEG